MDKNAMILKRAEIKRKLIYATKFYHAAQAIVDNARVKKLTLEKKFNTLDRAIANTAIIKCPPKRKKEKNLKRVHVRDRVSKKPSIDEVMAAMKNLSPDNLKKIIAKYERS